MASLLDFQPKNKQQSLVPDFDFKSMKISPTELANLLGLTTQRIGQLRRDGIIPPPSDGFFNLKDAVGGYIIFLKNSQDRRLEGDDRNRLIKLKADREQLELERKSRELIPRSEVEAENFRRGRIIRDVLLSIAPRVGPLVAPEADPFRCQGIIDREIRDLLAEVSNE